MDAAATRRTWKRLYEVAPSQLERMRGIGGAVTAFNANIDAVRKVKPAVFEEWARSVGAPPAALLAPGEPTIRAPGDLLRGFLVCFSGGIAGEWLVREEGTFAWMRQHLGWDRLQMGGQGGIIANTLAVCGVRAVYAHCASLPAQQAGLFVDRPNLLAAAPDGRLLPARSIRRDRDTPLLHWILEFDQGDAIDADGRRVVCPKANRFIATWDPENLRLAIDPAFAEAVRRAPRIEYALLSGYHMLSHPLPDGTSAFDRVADSMRVVDSWRAAHPGLTVHFEVASTQDVAVRAHLLERVAPWADSVGLNEQELIDLLVVAGEKDLAAECRAGLSSVSLFRGLEQIFVRTGVPRVQLHMFGLYVTLQRKGWRTPPATTRDGMILAATIAAAKAATGSIEVEESLLKAHGREVADLALSELQALAAHLRDPALAATGVSAQRDFDVVATPTILVDKPVTLVGMGDTISSLSLLGARQSS